MKLTREEREKAIIDLLWDYMKRDPEHRDRVRTGIGTKTKMGLAASVERIFEDENCATNSNR